MNLKTFIDESGITTYEGLTARCARLGVNPPDKSEFNDVVGVAVNNPEEGIVVLEAPRVVDEKTGDDAPDDNVSATESEVDPSTIDASAFQKRSRRRKSQDV